MLATHWARNFAVTQEDIDFLTNLLLEKETPMNTEALAMALIEWRLEQEKQAVADRYKDLKTYNPSHKYAVGDRVMFGQFDYETATVTGIRAGDNDDLGDFQVIEVEFDDADGVSREFAAELTAPHALSDVSADDIPGSTEETLSAEEIYKAHRNAILQALHTELVKSTVLRRVAGFWFVAELVMDVDIGTLHLAEAVLDMSEGGPLTTTEIIEQIGSIGDAPVELQVFSLNLAMNDDDRFDEVGPAGEVQWYLNRMEPEAVNKVPAILDYTEIPYDEDILPDEMIDLETELDDEFTPIDFEGDLQRATVTLIYPHRRAGTLPLNAETRQIFPVGRTKRIHVTFVDKEEDTRFDGWVVHEHHYVYGLEDYYTHYRLPIGAFVTVERGENPGEIIVSHDGYRPRTEWIPVVVPGTEQIQFENKKRAIGASYDEQIIVGVDDLESLDTLVKRYKNKTLATILRDLIVTFGKLSPQGTVHAVTLYSAANLLRRCPPGPLFAILEANPDFESAGDHYWKLSE